MAKILPSGDARFSATRRINYSGIADLPTRFGIERGLVEDQRNLISGFGRIDPFAVLDYGENFTFW